jgi:carbamate kinase
LIALGGNALIRPCQWGTIADQLSTLRQSLGGVVELMRMGHQLVLTHGNGPQVGHILIRAERARGDAYDLPLDACVAQSQGEIGFLIEQSLQNLMRERQIGRTVATVITRVIVDADDPHMRAPSKPIGPFLTRERADSLRRQGADVVEDAYRGYRRVVPSPRPRAILELEAIRSLFESGVVVIAGGGGGIPVRIHQNGSLIGVEAVVDKDFTSTLIALELKVTKIIDLTDVGFVKLNFNSPEETDLQSMTAAVAKRRLIAGHFLPGSMGPKIEAAIDFLEHGGHEVIVTRPENTLEAFRGHAGTHILPD